MKLKFTGEPYVMTMKNDARRMMTMKNDARRMMTMKNVAKFEEEFICHFKIDMRNLTNFDPSTQKFDQSMFELKK